MSSSKKKKKEEEDYKQDTAVAFREQDAETKQGRTECHLAGLLKLQMQR